MSRMSLSLFMLASLCWAGAAQAAEAPKGEAKEFADKVTVSNKFEIDTSKLALEYGKAGEIKAFAQSMIDDHSKAGVAFKAALAKADLVPPAEGLDVSHTAKYAKLRVFTTEKGFDRAYVDAQVAAHEEAVALFKGYAAQGGTPALKAFAGTTLPTLEHHLQMVKDCPRLLRRLNNRSVFRLAARCLRAAS